MARVTAAPVTVTLAAAAQRPPNSECVRPECASAARARRCGQRRRWLWLAAGAKPDLAESRRGRQALVGVNQILHVAETSPSIYGAPVEKYGGFCVPAAW